MLVLASQQQEQECGDGTNFVLVFAGSLLEHAEQLLRMVCISVVHSCMSSTTSCGVTDIQFISSVYIRDANFWAPIVGPDPGGKYSRNDS